NGCTSATVTVRYRHRDAYDVAATESGKASSQRRRSMRGQSVISQKPKKRRPSAPGKGEPILVRLQRTPLANLDHWIARQEDRPSRPEAIRRLVEQALAGSS